MLYLCKHYTSSFKFQVCFKSKLSPSVFNETFNLLCMMLLVTHRLPVQHYEGKESKWILHLFDGVRMVFNSIILGNINNTSLNKLLLLYGSVYLNWTVYKSEWSTDIFLLKRWKTGDINSWSGIIRTDEVQKSICFWLFIKLSNI